MVENFFVKKWHIFRKIIIIIMCVMIFLMFFTTIFFGFTVGNSLYMATEMLDLFALLVLLIIVEAIKNDERNMGNVTKESMCLLILSFTVSIGLFSDYYAWLVQGIAQYRLINYIANFLYYIAGPWSIYNSFLYGIFQKEGKATSCPKWVKITQGCIFFFAIFLVIINIFTGIYFTVGVDGFYRRTEGSFVFNALPNTVMMVITIILIFRSNISKRQKYSLLFFCFAPITASIIQIFFFGISVQFAIGVLGITLMYVNIQMEKNIEFAQQEAKLTQFQLQPHFLFNGMISIRALIMKSPEDAVAAMDHFMGYLRGSVDIMDVNSLIPVSQELKFVEDYLAIEKVRFGGNIQYSIRNEVEEDFRIPPITIQPLVENAVRYGIRQKLNGEGLVEINLFEKGKYHIVEIKDNGVGFDINEQKDDGRTHIGLINTTRRVRMISHGDIEVSSVVGEGTCVRIKIPQV